MQPPPRLLRVAVLAPPQAAGARKAVARAREVAVEEGRRLSLLLAGGGFAWLEEALLVALAGRTDVDVLLCSESARRRGLDATALPRGLRPSSLVAWLGNASPDDRLWTVLP